MAIDLMSYPENHLAVEKAGVAAELRSMEELVAQLSGGSPPSDCLDVAGIAIARSKRIISVINRTGHARFRRSPTLTLSPFAAPPPIAPVRTVTLDFTKPGEIAASSCLTDDSFVSVSTPITGDGSVSNGKQASAAILRPSGVEAPAVSAGKPPLPSSYKRKCPAPGHGHCHCSKKRKSLVKRTIRVPAISSRVADIPADDHSWRKYGQKPIKGSPYPRGYYRCSSVRNCPARKHVERAVDDPAMLIVTYEGEHRHAVGGAAPAGTMDAAS